MYINMHNLRGPLIVWLICVSYLCILSNGVCKWTGTICVGRWWICWAVQLVSAPFHYSSTYFVHHIHESILPMFYPSIYICIHLSMYLYWRKHSIFNIWVYLFIYSAAYLSNWRCSCRVDVDVEMKVEEHVHFVHIFCCTYYECHKSSNSVARSV